MTVVLVQADDLVSWLYATSEIHHGPGAPVVDESDLRRANNLSRGGGVDEMQLVGLAPFACQGCLGWRDDLRCGGPRGERGVTTERSGNDHGGLAFEHAGSDDGGPATEHGGGRDQYTHSEQCHPGTPPPPVGTPRPPGVDRQRRGGFRGI